MKKLIAAFSISCLLSTSTAFAATSRTRTTSKTSVLICIPLVKYFFNVNGAEEGDVGDMYSVVNYQKKTLSRCEYNVGCDQYSISTRKSGIYTNIQTTGNNGMLMKISNSGIYMEFATIGLDTVAYYGTCTSENI